MSSAPELTVSQPRAGRTIGKFSVSVDWITRPLFGVLLAGVAVGATIRGGLPFVIFMVLGAGAAVREWHRLFGLDRYLLPTVLTVSSMVAALLWQLYVVPMAGPMSQVISLACLLMACLANLVLGFWRGEAPLAPAAAPLYIGLPTVALLMLRQTEAHPVWLVMLVLLAVWSTDTGALFSGKLIGGPKLAPVLSPNKTWAGSIGGLLCAALISAFLAVFLGSAVLPAVLFATLISVAGQLGDLFESFVKRRMGRKDSGHLIPGHGGVLDRIDSILFAAPVAAFLILVIGFDPLAGAHL